MLDGKTVGELHAAAVAVARHLDGHPRRFALNAIGQALEGGTSTSHCRTCGRGFTFDASLFRHEPRRCFACRFVDRYGKRVQVSPGGRRASEGA